MRVGLMVVQDHHVLVIGQLGLCELSRGTVNGQWIDASWHRQDQVEGLARTLCLDQGATKAPFGQLAERLRLESTASIVLELEPTMLADIAEVGCNRVHPAPPAGDLDHHLRRPANDRGQDPGRIGAARCRAAKALSLGCDLTLTMRLPG